MSHVEANPIEVATNAIAMARAMRNLGRPLRAIGKYGEALAALPTAVEALDECLDLLEELEDWQAIADHCESWLRLFPDHATNSDADRIHGSRIDALCRLGGVDLAFDAYGLRPISISNDTVRSDEILCVIGLRNEAARLPHVLEHHRRIGVDRFLIIDNGSTDGSLDLLTSRHDTIVWGTTESYRSANCGAVWWQLLLRRYASGNWCLVVDADEYFIFPGWETTGLQELCAELDNQGSTCYSSILLDMYSSSPLSESVISSDFDLLETFPYFDRNWYRKRSPFNGPRHNLVNHWGGVRARVFGEKSMSSFLLDKVPLFRSRPDQVLLSGNHWLDRPSAEIGDGRGVTLHFKYDAEFAERVAREAGRAEHAGAARAYRSIGAELERNRDPRLFDPMFSVRYENSDQLVGFGIMRPTRSDRSEARTSDLVARPTITPTARTATTHEEEPFWSIVFVADFEDVVLRLASTCRALVDQPSSEILVVVTGGAVIGDLSFDEESGHVLHVVTTDHHLTEVEAMNLGIENSRGFWIHALEAGAVPTAEDFALAHEFMNEDRTQAVTVLVKATEDLASSLDLPFDLPASDLFVRREEFVTHGAFATTISGASIWEFVQRISRTDPKAIGLLSRSFDLPRTHSVPAVSLEFGEDIAHQLVAINLVTSQLATDDPAIDALLDRCSRSAIDRIIEDIERGRIASALAIASEILNNPISIYARNTLLSTLSRRIR